MKYRTIIFSGLFLVILLTCSFIYNTTNITSPNILSIPVDYDQYETEWKQVDSLIKKGLPKSALNVVNNIYDKSKEKDNHPQFIKSVIYRVKLMADFEDDFLVKSIKDIEDEILSSQFPVRNILYSLKADLYWRYYQANRYKILDRAAILKADLDDIQTWDLRVLVNQIVKNYVASLDNPDGLQKINLKDYNVILQVTDRSKKYRPSLYDFLAHRAVDFLLNDESSIVKPQYKFELDDKQYFTPALEFSKLDINSKDSLSLKFHGVTLLQELIRFHLNDEVPTAMLDVNLKRLQFVHQNSIVTDKDSLYLHAMLNLEKQTKVFPSSTDVSYLIAKEYRRQGAKYNPQISEEYKWLLKSSLDKCEEAIARFPESFGAHNCRVLQSQINESRLNITVENVNVPGKSFLSLVKYKNTEKLYYRIIRIGYEEYRDIKQEYRRKKDLLHKYKSMPFVSSWEVNLPNDSDFQFHSIESKMPALSSGHYIVIASTSQDFDLNKSILAYSSFWVSGISYISQKTPNQGYRFYLLDREYGNPLKNVNAQLYFKKYDFQKRRNIYVDGNNYSTDETGYLEIPAIDLDNNRSSFFLKFIGHGDTLVSQEYYYQSGPVSRFSKPDTKTWIFTDRSIYRPGQMVYFKGIVLEKSGDKYELRENYKTNVVLYDANQQKISELQLVTNKFGSFNGSFSTPQGSLNGRMVIKNESGSAGILVEEYKRPQFEVIINPVEGSYKLSEKVSISGNAVAYAGNNINNAIVKYRVVRKVVYPWSYGRSWFTPSSPSMEITHGFTTTDEEGKFDIDFVAIPDYSISPDQNPMFHYEITTDVTDINGETQSANTILNVAYKSLKINLGIEEVVEKSEINNVSISTTNLNGIPVPTRGDIFIFKLENSRILKRDKLWEFPDKSVMTKGEYERLFPFDKYKKDFNEKFQEEQAIVVVSFDTGNDSIITLGNVRNWESGKYAAIVKSKDEFGKNIEVTKYFTLYDQSGKKPPINEINWFHVIKDRGEPGEKIKFILGSGDKNVHVLYEIVQKDKILSKEWFILSNKQKLIEIPIREEYRGGFAVNIHFVKHNRSFSNRFNAIVPFSDKELDFEYSTFRDKLVPGQKEEWQLKIKNKYGDEVIAELLAGMYDVSLDKFVDHHWKFSLYPQSGHSLSWTGHESFLSGNFRLSIPPLKDKRHIKFHDYDQLNWFGFNYYGVPNLRNRTGDKGVFLEQLAMPGQVEDVGVDEKSEELNSLDSDGMENGSLIKNVERSERFSGPQVRRDFRETAFFFPTLKTNENGDVIISFTVPESLTRWKLMGLAHTSDLQYGLFEKEIVTQKSLMVVPNTPRFFRSGDKLAFTSKIVNMSDESLNGNVMIRFYNTRTMDDITNDVITDLSDKSFEVQKGISDDVSWELNIPEGIDLITYRITAGTEKFNDGEQNIIPVLSDKMLVTESIPLPLKSGESKTFEFHKLMNSNSGTLKNHKLTLEFSSNPAWYAIQTLPYIMNSSHTSADNIFRSYYANSIASYLVHSSPKIKQVFDTWKNYSPDALLSNLDKNEELKSVILQETPWVMDANNEKERKQRIALLFDLNNMSAQLNNSLHLLKQKQSQNGGWPWFNGMRENRNITQNIVSGFGHLINLKVIGSANPEINRMLKKAVNYVDGKIVEDYIKLKERHSDQMDKNHLNEICIQYLYCRTYFMDQFKLSKGTLEAFNYFRDQAKEYWVDQNIHLKGMIALSMQRLGVKSVPYDIMTSIEEHALYSDDMGMYWRENAGGYHWHESQIETQALLIECFDEITRDQKAVERMKIWLLKQKQTQNWKTPKATADAVYALLLNGSDWLTYNNLAEIRMGSTEIDPFELEDTKVEAGTGYFKTSWTGSEIRPEMGNILVQNKSETIAWGAVYWQYFEELDKISAHETPLRLDKKLFIESQTDEGPMLEALTGDKNAKVGDKIIVRIELRVDRNMEYVHMKDMRASALEPVSVISGYRYQGGLGYYESTLDASTNFFFDYLGKGTYVIEYPLVVAQKGEFSNGIATIQCMYAPEFTSHSEGVRIIVK